MNHHKSLFQSIALTVLVLALLTPTVNPPSVAAQTSGSGSPLPSLPALDSDCSDGQCVFGVAISADDAGPKPECGFEINWPEIYFGRCFSGPYITSGFRFSGITLDPGTQIQEAYLALTVDGQYTNPVTVNLLGEDSANAQPFSDTSQPKDRPRLSGFSTIWTINSTWNSGTAWRTPNIAPVVQAIVSESGWQNGNALAILTETANTNLQPGEHRRVFAIDRAGSSYAARLVVRVGSTSNVRPPVIFIPGIGGTEFRNTQNSSDQLLWIDAGKLTSAEDAFLDVMQLDTSGSQPLYSIPEYQTVRITKVIDTIANLHGVYKPFIDAMQSAVLLLDGITPYRLGQVGNISSDSSNLVNHVVDYDAGEDFWLFPVDFRKDLAGQADRLDVLINDVLANTDASQVHLVGHSQGGLIIRAYIADSARSDKVAKAVTLQLIPN